MDQQVGRQLRTEKHVSNQFNTFVAVPSVAEWSKALRQVGRHLRTKKHALNQFNTWFPCVNGFNTLVGWIRALLRNECINALLHQSIQLVRLKTIYTRETMC